MTEKADRPILIIGGGIVALTCALWLMRRDSQAVDLLCQPQHIPHDHPLSLTDANVQFLQSLGLDITGEPVKTLHLQSTQPFQKRIDAITTGHSQLGLVVSSRHLWQLLWQSCQQYTDLFQVKHTNTFSQLTQHPPHWLYLGDECLKQTTITTLSAHQDGSGGEHRQFVSFLLPITGPNWTPGHAWQILHMPWVVGIVPTAPQHGYLIATTSTCHADCIQSVSQWQQFVQHLPLPQAHTWQTTITELPKAVPSILAVSAQRFAGTHCLRLGAAAATMPPIGAQAFNRALGDIAALDRHLGCCRYQEFFQHHPPSFPPQRLAVQQRWHWLFQECDTLLQSSCMLRKMALNAALAAPWSPSSLWQLISGVSI